MYICIYVYVYIYIHTYIHTFIHTYIHTYIHTHLDVCVYIYIYIINQCLRIYIYIHTHTHTHVNRHVCIPLATWNSFRILVGGVKTTTQPRFLDFFGMEWTIHRAQIWHPPWFPASSAGVLAEAGTPAFDDLPQEPVLRVSRTDGRVLGATGQGNVVGSKAGEDLKAT